MKVRISRALLEANGWKYTGYKSDFVSFTIEAEPDEQVEKKDCECPFKYCRCSFPHNPELPEPPLARTIEGQCAQSINNKKAIEGIIRYLKSKE